MSGNSISLRLKRRRVMQWAAKVMLSLPPNASSTSAAIFLLSAISSSLSNDPVPSSLRARGDKADGGLPPTWKYSIVEGNGVKTKSSKTRHRQVALSLRHASEAQLSNNTLCGPRLSALPCERRPHGAQKSANGRLSSPNGIESAYLSANTSPVTLPA